MVCAEEAVHFGGRANGRALLQLLVRLAEPARECVATSVFARILNGLINFFQKRTHDAGLGIDGGEHDGNVHDLFLGLLPTVAAGDDGKRLKRVVPTALAELDVFKVELDERAAVCFNEVGNLRGVHNSVLQLHAAKAGESQRFRALDLAAHGWVRHLVLDGLHAGLLVQG